MSCIKFPSSKNDLSKTSSKVSVDDHADATARLIAIADQVFGQGKWSHAITNQTLDFIEYTTGKYHAGCVTIVRVQLTNGTFHEDMGYYYTEGSSKGSAIQKARFGSFNNAMKKALMSFGNEITNKINRPASRPSSPLAVESAPNKFLQIETKPISLTKSNIVAEEPFAENIPMSQTDVLMDIVDLDHLFDKDQNSNTVKNKEIKVTVSKPSTSAGIAKENTSTAKNKESSDINNIKNEMRTETKTKVQIGISNLTGQDNKSNPNNVTKQENEVDVPKTVVSTVMTEEEMRLERKRKQREMQEEFKRKQESKRKHTDIGSKQMPNPRY